MRTIDYTVLASGLYLTEPLPENWASLDLADIHLLCDSTILDAYDGQGVWMLIEESAYYLQTILAPIVARTTELICYRQKLYEATLASYHELLTRDSNKTITSLTERVQYLETRLAGIDTLAQELADSTRGALS